jgi:predicted DNA-binding transcriptional regulator AlpA
MKDGAAMPGWPLLLRREMAAAFLGLSPATFDGAVKDGLLPRAVPLVGSVKAWHRADLEAWAEDRRAAAENVPNEWDAA